MSGFEIVLLAITTFSGLSIVWSTLALGISPMPSSRKARQAMLQLIDGTGGGTGSIFELGCGWGSLLIPLAKIYPQRIIVGYELSLIPWLVTLLRVKILGLKNVNLYRQNFLDADLTDASVIFCYLFPEGMKALEHKLRKNEWSLKNGKLTYLISHNFSFKSYNPITIIKLDDLYKSPIYLYKFKA